MIKFRSHLRTRSDIGSGYEPPYDRAALRQLPHIAFLGAALFAGFAIFDVMSHSLKEAPWRLGLSLIPSAALLTIGVLSRSGFVAPRAAPFVAACAGIIGLCAPLMTIQFTKNEVELVYLLLITATGGALIFRAIPFVIMLSVSVAFFITAFEISEIPTENTGDWAATFLITIGLACALFIAQRSSVRRYADVESRLFFLAGHDPLTGLLNRNGLEIRSEALLALAQREKRIIFALFIDIDRLSQINNVHGHMAGDLVLSEIAVALTRLVRDSDLVARWGGDELVVIGLGEGPDLDRVELTIRADASLALQSAGLDGSVSAGLAAGDASDNAMTALIHLADAQMYERRRIRRESNGLRDGQ